MPYVKRFQLTVVILAHLLWVPSVTADIGDNTVGMNTHVPSQALVDACVDLGVSWIRVDANWFQMEPSENHYDLGYMDAVVSRANAGGLQVFMTLSYSPAWLPRHR